MKFWESRYQVRDFVRFTIVDQKQKEIAGISSALAILEWLAVTVLLALGLIKSGTWAKELLGS